MNTVQIRKCSIAILLLVFLIGGREDVRAQKLKNLEFQSITVNDGLSYSWVTCVFRDSHGYVWIGTMHGLNKYDGHSIKQYYYEANNPHSLCGNMITDILEDREGNLWISTWQSGVSKYVRDKDYFQSIGYNKEQVEGLSYNVVIQIEEDDEGNLWFVNGTEGLASYNLSSGSFTYYSKKENEINSISSNHLSGAYKDKKGNLWLASKDGTLDVFNIKGETFTQFPLPNYIQTALKGKEEVSILVDTEQIIWLGIGGSGLFTYSPFTSKWSKYQEISSDNITDIVQHGDNIFLVISLSAINVLNKKDNSMSYITVNELDNNSLNDNNAHNVYIDNQGILWVGAFTNGLNYSKSLTHEFHNYYPIINRNNTLSNEIITSICQTDNNRIFIATVGGGINEFFEKDQTFKRLYLGERSHPINADVLTCLYANKNKIYVGSFLQGLNVYNLDNGNIYQLGNDLSGYTCLLGEPKPIESAWSVLVDSKENTWMGTLNDGLYKFNEKDKVFWHYTNKAGDTSTLKGKRVIDILEDRSGTIWIATEGSGLNKYNADNNNFTQYLATSDSNSLSSNKLNSLMEDSKGDIWIGTAGGGINRLNTTNEQFTRYYKECGISSDLIYDIMEDKNGLLWISSTNGLYSFNPEIHSIISYDKNDGIISDQFGLTASLKANDGKFYFGTKEGLTCFYPEKIIPDTIVHNLAFTDFKVLNKSIKTGIDTGYMSKHISKAKEVNLSYKDYMFSIEFAAVEIINSEKIKYKYRMQGFDQQWTETDNKQRLATYTNLPGGEYTFQVMASKQLGIWNNPIELTVNIKPPIWKTNWFIILIILLGLTIVFLVITVRTRFLQTRKKQLELKVKERTIEISKQNEQILIQKAAIEKHKDDLEEQVAIRTKDLVEAKEKAEQADRLKTSFLSNMSHEIRTPMNAILGFIDILINDKQNLSNEKEIYYKNIIQSNGHSLVTLIDDIIDIARIESNEIRIERQLFNIMELLASLNIEYAEKLQLKNTKVNLNLSTGTYQEMIIDSDLNRVRQVLVNFLENALKFTSKGEITLGIKEKSGFLYLFVKDTGIGIDPKHHQFIFDRFTKLESDTQRLYRGTGIGLFISKRIIELLGYTLTIDSELGTGSEFSIKIPVSEIISKTEKKKVIPAKTSHRNWKGKTILIVEDEIANSQYLEFLLQKKDIKTLTVTNGEDAVNICKERKDIDLILMDIKMPKINGTVATRIIRSFNTKTPIIAQTAYAMVSERKEIIKSGCDEYLAKPISKGNLYDALDKYL